jgi:hypothetical protein
MSAIKATAYTLPFLFVLTSPSYASINRGGFHGGGFHGPSAFHGGAFNRGNFHGVARDPFFFSGRWYWCGPYEYEADICPFYY